MVMKQGGRNRPQDQSRSNKRIQALEERVAGIAKELRQLHEMLGTKVDTKELIGCVGRRIQVKDITGSMWRGTLEKVGKWTITLSGGSENPSIILFKGNIIGVIPLGGADEC